MVEVPEDLKPRFEELMKLDKEELALRLAAIEANLEAIDPHTKYLIMNINNLIRVTTRKWMPMLGILYGVEFEPKTLIIWRETKQNPYGTDKVIEERKLLRIPFGSIVSYEIIYDRLEREKRPDEEIPFGEY